MTESVDLWSDHSQHKVMLQAIRDLLRKSLDQKIISELRNNTDDAIARWLGSDDGVRFVFQGIQSRGATDEAALRLAVTPSAIGLFMSGMAALALYWIAYGGFESAKTEAITNDLLDLEYAILGALSDSLLTADRRLRVIHHAIASGVEGRAGWHGRR